jgi:hypothetical protein
MKITFVVMQPTNRWLQNGPPWPTLRQLLLLPPWHRLGRITGVAGLAAVVLILVPVVVGTRPEPAFNAAAAEVLAYYRSSETVAAPLRSFVFTVGLVTFVWFVGALSTLLRRVEGEAAWRSAIAMGSGVLSWPWSCPVNRCRVPRRRPRLSDREVCLR